MIYISGKISSSNIDEYVENIQRFMDCEDRLILKGYSVHNPARHIYPGHEWEDYLAQDLAFLCEEKPEMYVLRGWKDSRGARLEVAMAMHLGLPIQYEE